MFSPVDLYVNPFHSTSLFDTGLYKAFWWESHTSLNDKILYWNEQPLQRIDLCGGCDVIYRYHYCSNFFSLPISRKTNLDFTEAKDSEWQWHQLGHMQVCISLQTDNHASTPPLSFLQAGCSSCRLTNSVKSCEDMTIDITVVTYPGDSTLRCGCRMPVRRHATTGWSWALDSRAFSTRKSARRPGRRTETRRCRWDSEWWRADTRGTSDRCRLRTPSPGSCNSKTSPPSRWHTAYNRAR